MFIPIDLIAEILCRLPSKDLLTFKVVSKDWLRLITKPEFIQKHLERSKASFDEPKILVTSLSIADSHIDIIDSLTAERCLRNAHLLGSCDGLVLYLDTRDRKISAVNPSTGKSVVVVGVPYPSTDEGLAALLSSWFGRHPCTEEYVLVLVRLFKRPTRRLVFDVYSLSRGETLSPCCASEELDDPYCFFFERVGTLFRGRLHCLAMLSSSGETTILRYDFETTEVERMWCPQQKYGLLGVVDGCLCTMDRTESKLGLRFELWMMREYGVKESWTKLAKIIEGFDYCYNKLTPFAFCSNGDVVLYDGKRLELMKYSFREKEIKVLKKCTTNLGGVGVACVGSLVSPASIWT